MAESTCPDERSRDGFCFSSSRDAEVLQIYEGVNEIQRLAIAVQMAKQLSEREPVSPEIMPGAPGVAVGAEA